MESAKEEVLNQVELKKHGVEVNYIYSVILLAMGLLTGWSMFEALRPAMGLLALPIAIALPAFFEVGVVGWWRAWEHVLSSAEQKNLAKEMTNWHIGASVGLLALNLIKAGAISAWSSLKVDGMPVMDQYTSLATVETIINSLIALLTATMAYKNIVNRRDFREYDTQIKRKRQHAAAIQSAEAEIDTLRLEAELEEKKAELQVMQANAVKLAIERGRQRGLTALQMGDSVAPPVDDFTTGDKKDVIIPMPVDDFRATGDPDGEKKNGKTPGWLARLGGAINPPPASMQKKS